MRLLTGKIFTMGGQYTVCDAYLLVFYRWGYRAGWDMKTQFPNWTRQALRVASRPTVKRVFEAEGVKLRFVASARRQRCTRAQSARAGADLQRSNANRLFIRMKKIPVV